MLSFLNHSKTASFESTSLTGRGPVHESMTWVHSQDMKPSFGVLNLFFVTRIQCTLQSDTFLFSFIHSQHVQISSNKIDPINFTYGVPPQVHPQVQTRDNTNTRFLHYLSYSTHISIRICIYFTHSYNTF